MNKKGKNLSINILEILKIIIGLIIGFIIIKSLPNF